MFLLCAQSVLKAKATHLDTCSLKFTALMGFTACLLCCNLVTPIVADNFYITKHHACSACILPCHSRHSVNVVTDNDNSLLTNEVLLNLPFMLSTICKFLCIEDKHEISLCLERIFGWFLVLLDYEQHTIICWYYFLFLLLKCLVFHLIPFLCLWNSESTSLKRKQSEWEQNKERKKYCTKAIHFLNTKIQ